MINKEQIEPSLKELEDLAIIKSAAVIAYNDAIKEVAKKFEMDKSDLRRLITVRVSDSKSEDIEAIERLSGIIEELA